MNACLKCIWLNVTCQSDWYSVCCEFDETGVGSESPPDLVENRIRIGITECIVNTRTHVNCNHGNHKKQGNYFSWAVELCLDFFVLIIWLKTTKVMETICLLHEIVIYRVYAESCLPAEDSKIFMDGQLPLTWVGFLEGWLMVNMTVTDGQYVCVRKHEAKRAANRIQP